MSLKLNNVVNYLQIPEDIEISSQIWNETISFDTYEFKNYNFSSNISDIDLLKPPLCVDESKSGKQILIQKGRRSSFYEIYKVLESFPPKYLEALNNFKNKEQKESLHLSESPNESEYERESYLAKLTLKIKTFFDEECVVFKPNDESLLKLQIYLNSPQYKVHFSSKETKSAKNFYNTEFSISPPNQYLLISEARNNEYVNFDHPNFNNQEQCKEWIDRNFK